MGQIRAAVAAARTRTNRDEYGVDIGHRLRSIVKSSRFAR
jgi:hypothetical protein